VPGLSAGYLSLHSSSKRDAIPKLNHRNNASLRHTSSPTLKQANVSNSNTNNHQRNPIRPATNENYIPFESSPQPPRCIVTVCDKTCRSEPSPLPLKSVDCELSLTHWAENRRLSQLVKTCVILLNLISCWSALMMSHLAGSRAVV
jgi:hypothetical protein